MTEHGELVVKPPLSREAAAHPLAHQSGIEALLQALPAFRAWASCSRLGRCVLRRMYDELHQLASTTPPGTALDLSAVPVTGHPATLAALARRGLVADGHLTPLGGLTVHWCAGPTRSTPYDPGEHLPAAQTTGGRL
jgi:hypothetical protein